ncbi:hemerythrin HHE cation binding domain-containing protein [Aspergillus cavernicola]|uniref:Hemerythrin HHE cation binding domain-containing protein n=1 Tax=Aspergillus cavernicola TaxID=176166 RepID=A0ABR4ILM7_9EURO
MTPRITDAIKTDHRELENHYNKILSASTEREKIHWKNLFIWELARHSIGEELVVYPVFEKSLPDGRAMADKDRHEHNMIKDHLQKFQNMQPSNPELEPTLNSLMNNLSQHIQEEENNDFPKLEDAISSEESEKLSTSFARIKMFVPTPSYASSSAPDKPPFESAVGLMAAPIDHLANRFRAWLHTSAMPDSSAG